MRAMAVGLLLGSFVFAGCDNQKPPAKKQNNQDNPAVDTTSRDWSPSSAATLPSGICSETTVAETCAANPSGCRWVQGSCVTYRGMSCDSLVQNECVSPCSWNGGRCVAVPSAGYECPNATSQAACQSSTFCAWNAVSQQCLDSSQNSCKDHISPVDCRQVRTGAQCYWSSTQNVCREFTSPAEQCKQITQSVCESYPGCAKSDGCVAKGSEKPNPFLSILTTIANGVFQRVAAEAQSQSGSGGGLTNMILGLFGGRKNAGTQTPWNNSASSDSDASQSSQSWQLNQDQQQDSKQEQNMPSNSDENEK